MMTGLIAFAAQRRIGVHWAQILVRARRSGQRFKIGRARLELPSRHEASGVAWMGDRPARSAHRQTLREMRVWNPTARMIDAEIAPPKPTFTMFQPTQNLS
jgi:hypothetical protein